MMYSSVSLTNWKTVTFVYLKSNSLFTDWVHIGFSRQYTQEFNCNLLKVELYISVDKDLKLTKKKHTEKSKRKQSGRNVNFWNVSNSMTGILLFHGQIFNSHGKHLVWYNGSNVHNLSLQRFRVT